jgi:hypothetical protein
MKTIISNNIVIRERQEESVEHVYHYCEVLGTKWINRCKLPWGRLRKGDIFNAYRMEYTEDGKGNVKEWTCEHKYGCEYDGVSVVSSLLALDQYIDENDYLRRELVPNSPTPWAYWKPLEVFVFDGEHFTELQAGAVTYQEAVSMADESKPKDERKVFSYTHYSASFASDYKAGCMDGGRYHIRTIAGEKAPKVY